MTDIVPVTAVTPGFDYSGLRLERTANGHVVSPWFSYDYRQYHSGPIYAIGSHFHSVRFQSIAAFAQALGIRPDEVVVSQMEDNATGDLKWRLGTQHPVVIPELLLRATMLASQEKYLGVPRVCPATTQRVIGPAIYI